ncbi:MAG TPA: hypothetical protein VFD84_16970 [Candidatus Binatia bacterium]|nr:hypothetical protein [Candidatus Binatia bacterium]
MKRTVLLVGVLAVAGRIAAAAVVTVSDCTTPDPHVHVIGGRTVLDVGTDDLVLACPLAPLGTTHRVRVVGNRVTIQGPDAGIAADGKGNAVDVRASDTIVVDRASLEASNGNGIIRLRAQNGLDIEHAVLTTGDATKAGRSTVIECSAPGCPLTMLHSTVLGHSVKVRISGTITAVFNTIVTRGGRDLIDVRALRGDADLCCNQMGGGTESATFIRAFGEIDLTSTEINRAEGITIASGLGGSGPTNLRNATLNNDFGKQGQIVVTAANGSSQVNIAGATLIDDDFHGPDVSSLNGRETLPHEGFANTVGTPKVDM